MGVKDSDKPLETLDQRLEELRELTRSLEKARDGIVGLRDQDAHTAVRDAAARYNISDEALMAFVENAGELLNGQELSVEDARRAGMLAAAGAAWENELGPLLTSAQVRELLGNVSRQRVDELLRSRRLIGMSDRSGRRRFPLFQFRDGRPIETLVAELLDGGRWGGGRVDRGIVVRGARSSARGKLAGAVEQGGQRCRASIAGRAPGRRAVRAVTLDRFPQRTLRADREIYRIHRVATPFR